VLHVYILLRITIQKMRRARGKQNARWRVSSSFRFGTKAARVLGPVDN
jgi:hypothetical protein